MCKKNHHNFSKKRILKANHKLFLRGKLIRTIFLKDFLEKMLGQDNFKILLILQVKKMAPKCVIVAVG